MCCSSRRRHFTIGRLQVVGSQDDIDTATTTRKSVASWINVGDLLDQRGRSMRLSMFTSDFVSILCIPTVLSRPIHQEVHAYVLRYFFQVSSRVGINL